MTHDSPAPLRVLLLGPLRDQLGLASAEIAFPADGTQASFWKELGEKFPTLVSNRLRLARDDEFLAATAPLRPGDELALIPPVSGG
jgi:molybdopterin converting factor small subunit